jgi:hypothetical protein
MPSPSIQSEPTREYLSCVEREEEFGLLRGQAKIRKSLLLFGPEGVGKSRLLRKFIDSQPLALYVRETGSPRELLLALLDALNSAGKGAMLPRKYAALSTCSLKGITQRALDTQSFLMVLDHLEGPSRITTGMIKDLHYYGRTPVILAARSPHMEDIGTLQPLCANKSERIEVKNWPQHIALKFAQHEAERSRLWASNLDSSLHSLVEWSDGNPAAIISMLRMAQLPKYRTGDQIKAHVLYLDHRMGRR